jgi:hypothetical protein
MSKEDLREELREDLREQITLRDHFAGLAMQGILTTLSKAVNSDSVAQMAYNMADAMLAERNKHHKERHEELCNE